MWCWEATPELQATPEILQSVYLLSPITGEGGAAFHFVKIDPNGSSSLTVNHQSEYPAVTISFNLAPGVALSRRRRPSRTRARSWGRRPR